MAKKLHIRPIGAAAACVLGLTAALLFCLGLRRPAALPADAAQVLPAEGQKLIALTFDDGPRRSTTAALLDGLAERGVRATFFLIGSQVPDNADLVLRMAQEGHQIGVHTYDHVSLTGLNQADFSAQVGRTRELLTSITGQTGFILRPPYGMVDDGVRAMAGSPIILWSIDPEDWRDKDTAREVAHILSEAKDGSIILLHDIYPTSVEAALQVVDALHAQGYLFCTVDELFALRHIPLESGESYRHAYP